MSQIIKDFEVEVNQLQKDFDSLNLENEAACEAFSEKALEVLDRLKKKQDTEEYFDLNDDFEDLIFDVITMIGHLDKEEI